MTRFFFQWKRFEIGVFLNYSIYNICLYDLEPLYFRTYLFKAKNVLYAQSFTPAYITYSMLHLGIQVSDSKMHIYSLGHLFTKMSFHLNAFHTLWATDIIKSSEVFFIHVDKITSVIMSFALVYSLWIKTHAYPIQRTRVFRGETSEGQGGSYSP